MYILVIDNDGSFSSSLEEEFIYRGIRIYKKECYFISLSMGYSFKDGTKMKQLEKKKYVIHHEEGFCPIEIFVYEGERRKDCRLFRKENFLLSYGNCSHVKTEDPYLKKSYLLLKDGVLESRSKYLRVNGKKYDGRKLKDGDRVELLSFFMVYGTAFLYIDTSTLQLSLRPYPIQRQLIVYQEERMPAAAVYPRREAAAPSFSLERTFDPPKPPENHLLRQIIPAFLMSSSMMVLAYVNFLSSSSSLIYMIMPGTMMISGTLLPMLFSLHEKRKWRKEERTCRKAYLDYLQKEKKRIGRQRETYEERLKEEVINLQDLSASLFQGDIENPKIQLGYRSKKLELALPESGDPEIEKAYEALSEEATLPSRPFFFDLKGKRRISFLCRKAEREGIFRRILLECACRFSFQKVKIAIAVKDPSSVSDLYRLPHLYFSKERLILTSLKDLEEIDQRKREEKLIVFFLDSFGFSFRDPEVLSLSFLIDEVLSESNCVIEYRHQDAVIYDEEKTVFHPFPVEDLSSCFRYLERFCIFPEERFLSFRDLFPKLDLKENYTQKGEGLSASFAVVDGEAFSLDIHEKKSGPHGLIGGTTGSGKSELIISFLLSLCLVYPPSYLQIVLIDFKGSGIRDSLCFEGEQIPHLSACTDDLDSEGVERLLYALKKECQRREVLFRKAGEELLRPVDNLDEYLEGRREDMEEIGHLLIVVDEFAQLKKEHPEMIRELIAISRIGRSLGLHLILSTQRPSSAVDEEIFANSRFKIALRVFEEKESSELLHRKDAAYLKEPGEFVLSVDNAVYKGKSVYAKSDREKDPCEIALLDPRLRITRKKRILFPGRKAENLVLLEEILKVSKELSLPSRKLLFQPPSPEKRKPKKGYYFLGQKDDYIRADREYLYLPVKESLLICSSRKKEVNAFLNGLEEEDIPVILFCAERRVGKVISDSLLYSEKEDILFLLKELEKPHPPAVLLIEDVPLFLSYEESYFSLLEKILRNPGKYALYPLLFSSVSYLPHRILSSVKNRILIRLSSREDQMNLFCRVSDRKGESFFEKEEVLPFVPLMTEEFVSSPSSFPPFLRKIPTERFAEERGESVLLGYDMKTREKVFYPKKEDLLIVSGKEELLKPYRSYGYECRVYRGEREKRENILWLGTGVLDQRLFFPALSNDIDEGEACLFSRFKKGLLKGVNNE
ncbi:MAG: hypothetical protein IIZ33_01705 [Erysipelotrichaceae bacterium]|nr:hypothetical protein [Erysipelotrichaceae bacterium]